MFRIRARLLKFHGLILALLLPMLLPIGPGVLAQDRSRDLHFPIDHVAWIVDQETLEAIAAAPMFKHEFANTRVRKAADGSDRPVAIYVYGALTILEFVQADTARKLGLEVDLGAGMVAFNAEREGSVDWIIAQMAAKYPESNPSKHLRTMTRGAESVPWSYVANFDYESGHEGFGAWVKELHPEFKHRMTGGRSAIGDITRERDAPPIRHHTDQLFRDVVSVTAAVSEQRRKQLVGLLAELGYEITHTDQWTVCTGQENIIRLAPKTNQKYAITQVRLALMRAKKGQKVFRLGSDIVLKFTDGPEAVLEFGGAAGH